MDDILVSINCITYNHEDYIRDAIEGFLMQKTNFKYEILIHDDASTDKTADIIREYEIKYPELIKPIYQTENQYSKGVKVGQFNRNRALGKYIALCEGDDYWIDSYKLQKQVDIMEQNPEYGLCFHAVDILDDKKNRVTERPRFSNKDLELNNDILFPHNSKLTPTCSFLYRRKLLEPFPNLFNVINVGDYPLSLILSAKSRTFYLNDVMGVYRRNVAGSYTERAKLKEIATAATKRQIHFLNEYNLFTNFRYKEQIHTEINKIELNLLYLKERNKYFSLSLILNDKFKEYTKQLPLMVKTKRYFRAVSPKLYELFKYAVLLLRK